MHSDAYSDVYEMPVGRVAIIGTVLTHGGHEGPVLEGKSLDGNGSEELGEGLILGKIGLEKGKIRDRTL